MKPNFALDLSHEGINLLHRSKGGWTLVGSVALDDPDMPTRLGELRRTAAMLESGGFTTKVIIPDSQILYTTLDAPGPDDISREVQIRAALDGLTPYPVGELVFDWRAEGEKAHVAVLARETMDEAESFAAQYRFNPVSFVARPGRGVFSGEPFFGKTRAAAQILPPGERVDPDASPVPRSPRLREPELAEDTSPSLEDESVAPEPIEASVSEVLEPVAPSEDDPFAELDQLAAELSGESPETPAESEKASRKPRRKRDTDGPRVAAPVLAPFPPTPDEVDEGVMSAPRSFMPKPEKPARPAPKPSAPKADDAAPARETTPVPEDEPTIGADTPVLSDVPEDDVPAMPSVSFTSTRAPASSGADTSSDRLAGVAPRIGVADRGERPTGAIPPTPSATASGAETPPKSAPPLEMPPMAGHDRVRAEMAEALAKPLPRAGQAEAETDKGPGLLGRVKGGARKAASSAGAAAAAQKAKRDARKAEAAEAALSRSTPEKAASEAPAEKPQKSLLGGRRKTVDSEREREAEAMTVFGARKTQTVPNRPKYLGLIMTLVLLLLMAAVAIWSTFLVDDGQTSLFNPGPNVTTETPVAAADPVTEETPAPETPEPPATAEVLSPEAAQARYAATGIWQRAPDAPAEPETTRLDSFQVASLGDEVLGRSASPLPDASSGGEIDAALANPLPPPPAGTTFNLDENGLVVPTPEGALGPTGVVVYSGRPAVVPPAPPAALVPEPEPAAQPEAAATDAIADTALAAAVDAAVAATETAAAAPLGPGAGEPFALPGVPRIRPAARPATIPPAPAPTPEPEAAPAEPATEVPATDENAALIRPEERPEAPPLAVADTAAIDAAVDNVIQAAFADATELAVEASRKPTQRPSNFERIVASAQSNASDGSVVLASAAPAPVETVAPAIPTSASVASRATTENALNLRQINLIGIYGSSSSRRALVRLSNGRYVKVEVGDRLDGGKVTSISSSKLTYQKGSRAYTLEVLPLG